MPNKFARSNGDFNDASIWSGLAASMSATSVPGIGDNASANTFTIQITGNVACDNITNGITYGGTAGGTFNLGNGTQVVANILGGAGATITISGTNSSSISGNLTPQGGVGGNHCVSFNSSGILFFQGNSTGSSNGASGIVSSGIGSVVFTGNIIGTAGNFSGNGLQNTSSGSVIVYGNINGGGTASGLNNSSTGSVTVIGNLNGATDVALSNTSTGSVTVIGNLNGSTAAGLSNTSTGPVTVLGNVISDSRGGAGIASTNAAANVRISGNLIGAPNGIPAVYAAAYTVNPIPSQTYIRYANNGTGVGSDAYLYQYTTDSLSAFSVPPVSSVRAGLQYANNTLTGSCNVPLASSVTFGTPVDNTTGTALLRISELSQIFNASLSSLTVPNTVGSRIRTATTTEATGNLIASFTNG